MAFMPPTSSTLDSKIQTINWGSLTLDEFLEILRMLGTGFNMTLEILLSKLRPSQRVHLMNLIKQMKIGKKDNKEQNLDYALVEYFRLKSNSKIPIPVRHALFIILCRNQIKNKHRYNPFRYTPNQNFAPASI